MLLCQKLRFNVVLMRVAFVSTEYPPFVSGGGGTYAYNITKNLAKLGNEIHVISPQIKKTKDIDVEDEVFVHRISVSESNASESTNFLV